MITQSAPLATLPSWQKQLAMANRTAWSLLQDLGLEGQLPLAKQAELKQFPVKVTPAYLAKMRYGDPDDPLLRQVLPLVDESEIQPGFGIDPVGDVPALRSAGLLQKYAGRALLVTTGACAIHCRYCFRKAFDYAEQNPLASERESMLATLRADTSLHEIILSGGDPWVLSDEKLAALTTDLSSIAHLQTLRIHTRLPVVLPERITPGLLHTLSQTRLKVVVVIHSNHANELDQSVHQALQALQQAGCLLLNQSVLLRGVNDNADSLIRLSQRLLAMGVLPYYLHLLDRVRGAQHFEVPESQARQLMTALRHALPGYLVPKLVREIPGERSKTPIS